MDTTVRGYNEPVTALPAARNDKVVRVLDRPGFAEAVLDTAGALIIVVDAEGGIVLFNHACEQLTGYSFAQIQGRQFWDVLTPADERDSVRRAFGQLRAGNFPGYLESHWVTKDGRKRRIAWANTSLIRAGRAACDSERSGPAGGETFLIGSGQDITDQAWMQEQVEAAIAQVNEGRQVIEKQAIELQAANSALEALNATLETMAMTDGLTGLANHRAFQERLRGEISNVLRHGVPLSLLLLDVDSFKQFNDRHGHPAGDGVLSQVGKMLQDLSRAGDCACRYGGEEFAVILPNTDGPRAVRLAERIRAAIESADWPHRPITVSIGVTSYPVAGGDQPSLIAAADRALYAAKAAGRNCIRSESANPRSPSPQANQAHER